MHGLASAPSMATAVLSLSPNMQGVTQHHACKALAAYIHLCVPTKNTHPTQPLDASDIC